MTKEYGQVKPEEMAKKTTLRTHIARRLCNTNLHLYHLSPGYEIAGSALRLQPHEVWGVRYSFAGTYHGKRFKSLHEAEGYFNQLKGGE